MTHAFDNKTLFDESERGNLEQGELSMANEKPKKRHEWIDAGAGHLHWQGPKWAKLSDEDKQWAETRLESYGITGRSLLIKLKFPSGNGSS